MVLLCSKVLTTSHGCVSIFWATRALSSNWTYYAVTVPSFCLVITCRLYVQEYHQENNLHANIRMRNLKNLMVKNLMARIQEQLERIKELETNEDFLRSLLTQSEKDLLDAETRSALRDAEARSALSDAQSLFKKELGEG
jgi:hypothetical protein